jgi:hypothetical protein
MTNPPAGIDQDIDRRNNKNGSPSRYFLSLFCMCPLMCPEPQTDRGYAIFKAFYYPRTPPTYEPPHFHPGDSEAERFFFSTRGKNEVPERWGFGKLETGWHG